MNCTFVAIPCTFSAMNYYVLYPTKLTGIKLDNLALGVITSRIINDLRIAYNFLVFIIKQ